jgi:hypothetical protein
MFAPEQQLTVTLSAERWNMVLTVLGDGPFRVVNPLIQDMQRQLMSQQDEKPDKVIPFPPQQQAPEGAA